MEKDVAHALEKITSVVKCAVGKVFLATRSAIESFRRPWVSSRRFPVDDYDEDGDGEKNNNKNNNND